ncbi:hypothetical protein DPMN_137051 [Dreissena polymorpha]|uniref:ATP-dependent RNA helicase n=1 Tax=Dreissena polymorpha TaxID=45954 RepID=A0A9D4G411_DREPO|nr:hypothetical protein DPMN_137051 [Dreissena polymorpha]
MTSVQFSTIPKLIEGGDLLVKSQTGSGKTMAYAIPIVENLARLNPKLTRGDGCRVVVLVPTREVSYRAPPCLNFVHIILKSLSFWTSLAA